MTKKWDGTGANRKKRLTTRGLKGCEHACLLSQMDLQWKYAHQTLCCSFSSDNRNVTAHVNDEEKNQRTDIGIWWSTVGVEEEDDHIFCSVNRWRWPAYLLQINCHWYSSYVGPNFILDFPMTRRLWRKNQIGVSCAALIGLYLISVPHGWKIEIGNGWRAYVVRKIGCCKVNLRARYTWKPIRDVYDWSCIG